MVNIRERACLNIVVDVRHTLAIILKRQSKKGRGVGAGAGAGEREKILASAHVGNWCLASRANCNSILYDISFAVPHYLYVG